jgi:hypothetical protein
MKDLFLAKFPTAKVTQYSSVEGDVIVMVNGQTAYNKEDRHNAYNWLTMMENAYYRSLN